MADTFRKLWLTLNEPGGIKEKRRRINTDKDFDSKIQSLDKDKRKVLLKRLAKAQKIKNPIKGSEVSFIRGYSQNVEESSKFKNRDKYYSGK